MKRVLTALAATLPFAANAADAISGAVERQPTNWQAIIMFLIFVVFTLGITYCDAPRDKCTLSCAINGIHAAFHYLKKNYISGCVMTVPTG